MPGRRTQTGRGSKKKYTEKQKRQAEHIEEGYEAKGMGRKRAAGLAWATVNKESGGGEKSGSGRKKSAAAKLKARKSVGKSAAKTRKKLGKASNKKRSKAA